MLLTLDAKFGSVSGVLIDIAALLKNKRELLKQLILKIE